jgi:hypothetical protein
MGSRQASAPERLRLQAARGRAAAPCHGPAAGCRAGHPAAVRLRRPGRRLQRRRPGWLPAPDRFGRPGMRCFDDAARWKALRGRQPLRRGRGHRRLLGLRWQRRLLLRLRLLLWRRLLLRRVGIAWGHTASGPRQAVWTGRCDAPFTGASCRRLGRWLRQGAPPPLLRGAGRRGRAAERRGRRALPLRAVGAEAAAVEGGQLQRRRPLHLSRQADQHLHMLVLIVLANQQVPGPDAMCSCSSPDYMFVGSAHVWMSTCMMQHLAPGWRVVRRAGGCAGVSAQAHGGAVRLRHVQRRRALRQLPGREPLGRQLPRQARRPLQLPHRCLRRLSKSKARTVASWAQPQSGNTRCR